jgi:2'-5' RNA ligase
MQKYVIVTFLENIPDGTEFAMSAWPLHITLAANFTIKQSEAQLNQLVANFSRHHKAFEAIADEDDYFGAEGQVLVTKLAMNPRLKSFHSELISLLESTGANFDQPQYNNEGYIAHATVWREKRLNKGDKVVFDRISIVDMFPNNDIKQRKVLASFSLLSN